MVQSADFVVGLADFLAVVVVVVQSAVLADDFAQFVVDFADFVLTAAVDLLVFGATAHYIDLWVLSTAAVAVDFVGLKLVAEVGFEVSFEPT